MRLRRLQCDGFRCLKAIDFSPGDGLTFLRGKNAQGKTSVLESILYAATSKSHRTNTEKDLVDKDGDGFRITIDAQGLERNVTLEAFWRQGAKRFKVNGVALERVSDILGHVSTILFSPEDTALVRGGASVRRAFMDMELSQLSPVYLNALQDYRKALRQRNELLRQPRVSRDLLEAWDPQLARAGSELIAQRTAYLEELSELAQNAYRILSDGEALRAAYKPDVAPDEDLDDLLQRSADNDIRRRQTTRGPHRDDITLAIEGQPARSHGSQGQQKTAALCLRLADLELVKRRNGEYPVLMLDEVFSELDAERARRLFEYIDPEVQCIITTTETDPAWNPTGRDTTQFLMETGQLHPI
jgi:DNA replication and repair protein RecF